MSTTNTAKIPENEPDCKPAIVMPSCIKYRTSSTILDPQNSELKPEPKNSPIVRAFTTSIPRPTCGILTPYFINGIRHDGYRCCRRWTCTNEHCIDERIRRTTANIQQSFQTHGYHRLYHVCLSCINFHDDKKLRKFIRREKLPVAVRHRAVEILKDLGAMGGFITNDYRSDIDGIQGLHQHGIIALQSAYQITHHAIDEYLRSGWVIRLFPRNRKQIEADPSIKPEYVITTHKDLCNVANYILEKAVIGVGSRRCTAYARFGFR